MMVSKEEFDAFINSLPDKEIEEYFQDMEADRVINERKIDC